jgi:LCP family protein required for cell wall assembly
MRTTLKRGVGRGAELNGRNGRAVLPPAAATAIVRYRQPEPERRSGVALLGRILLGTILLLVSFGLAVAGGSYLYLHQSVAEVRAHTPDVIKAQKQLQVALPGQAAIALVVGSDHRYTFEGGLEARSDTIMLLRADPQTKTISMLSFPRDLIVDVHCPGHAVVRDRINSAYSRCGARGTLQTVKALTDLPVNYLITVNFHGFRQIVDKLGGVWLDVDRRYYNHNVGTAATDFADIDLQPGYQRLDATHALQFVRYRHTDSDLFRLARQQQFVRAFKEQIAHHFSVRKLPSIISAVRENVEVGTGGGALQAGTVLSYGLFAATLPGGHFFQPKIQDLTGYGELTAPPESIQAAVNQFQNPDPDAARVANAAALGTKLKEKAPPPQQTTVTVLNGNGVPGAAANGAYAIGQRGYRVLLPPNDLKPNAPTQTYFHTKIYFDKRQPRAQQAAVALQKLMQPADVQALPNDPALRALNPGSMLLVVLGTTFHGDIAAAPVHTVAKRQPPFVRLDPSASIDLLRPLAARVPFPLYVPTVVERASRADTLPGDKPVRFYYVQGKHKAVRLVFMTGAGEFWGVEQTDWTDAPVLADKSFRHNLGGREFDLYYSGPHLHMVVLRANGANYWVVNTLLDSLSNETMLAIARGLKPLTNGK